MLIKKIGGNWHRILVWQHIVIAYKSGGIVILWTDDNTEKYIPFYNFSDFTVLKEKLWIKTNDNQVFYLRLDHINKNINHIKLEKSENQYPLIHRVAIDFSKLDNLLDEVRSSDYNEQLIVIAYKQKGIDIFDKKTNKKIVHFDFPGYSSVDDVKLYNNRIYVADVFGLRIIDISNIKIPVLNDSHIYKGWPKDVAVKNQYVLVADVLGIKIYDRLNQFSLVGKIESNKNRIAKISVLNNYAFLSCEAVGLKIADISDIKKPYFVSGVILSKGAWDSYPYQNFVYIAAYTQGLLKVDFSEIRNLKLTDKYISNHEIIGVSANHKGVFAACSYTGLKIFTHNLELIAEYGIDKGRCWGVLIHGDIVYAACGDAGVLILDISNINFPGLISTINTSQARDIVLIDNILYIADGQNGVLSFDVSDIRRPFAVGQRIVSAAFTRGVMVDKDFIYKADGDGGLEVYGKF